LQLLAGNIIVHAVAYNASRHCACRRHDDDRTAAVTAAGGAAARGIAAGGAAGGRAARGQTADIAADVAGGVLVVIVDMAFGVLYRMADGALHPVTVLVVGHFHLVVVLKSARIQRHRIMLYCAIFRIIVHGHEERCIPSVHCADGVFAKHISGFCVQTHLKGVPFACLEGAGDRLAAYTIALDPVDLGVTNVCSVVQNNNSLVRHFVLFGGGYTEIHLLDHGQHPQREPTGLSIAAVVGIGHFGCAAVHRQDPVAYRAALPIGCPARVKTAGQRMQVKGAGLRGDLNRIFVALAAEVDEFCAAVHIQRCQLIVSAVQVFQFRVLAQIQLRQLVLPAIQLHQCCIIAHIQFCQLVFPARQPLQCCIRAHIQFCQLVCTAMQLLQFFILAHIQFCQLVCHAIQRLQFFILAHIQFCQLVTDAIQLRQVGKKLNALQATNVHKVDIDCFDCVPLFL